MTWEVTEAVLLSDESKDLLADGWEPFSVYEYRDVSWTERPDGEMAYIESAYPVAMLVLRREAKHDRAQGDSRCSVCQGAIEDGQHITFLPGTGWRHSGCDDG